MRHLFYTNSKDAWQGMYQAIESAVKSVYLEMYIFEGAVGPFNFTDVLARKAQEGLTVVVILDTLGSAALTSTERLQLETAGVELLFYSSWLTRLHRKTLIIDERVAFVGGVNIGRQFARWNDLQLRFTGRIVRSVLRSFARTYKNAGGTRVSFPTAPLSAVGRAQMWFVEHGFSRSRTALTHHYVNHIASAKTKVLFVTPYLLPPRKLLGAIHQALLRGVSVTILTPFKTDHPFVTRTNHHYLALLQRLGATCLVSDRMNHAKVMMIDDREAIIGSQNLDVFSFNMNAEAGVFFTDPRMLEELQQIIEVWKLDTRPFEDSSSRTRWFDAPARFITRMLEPFF